MSTEEPKKCGVQETFEAAAAIHNENDRQEQAYAAAKIAATEELRHAAREIKTYLQTLVKASNNRLRVRETLSMEKYKNGKYADTCITMGIDVVGRNDWERSPPTLDVSQRMTIKIKKEDTFFSNALKMEISPQDDMKKFKTRFVDICMGEDSLYCEYDWKPTYKGPVALVPVCREVGELLGRILTRDQLALIETNIRAMKPQGQTPSP